MEPKIIGYRSTTTQGPSGQNVPAIEVSFKVGDYGPFTQTFAQSTFTAAAVKQAVQSFASHIQQLHQ